MAWKSIKTAPKDRRIWLFGTAKTWDGYERPDAMVIGVWNSNEWCIRGQGQPREETIVATYWQDLPKPPKKND